MIPETPRYAASPTLPRPRFREAGIAKVRIPSALIQRRWGKIALSDEQTEIGNRPVRDATFLRTRLVLLLVGDVAEFAVLRDGKPLNIQATVAERDQRPRAR